MMPENFNGLVVLSKTTPSSRIIRETPQVHPRYQLAILLYRLGNLGGVTHEDTSTLLGLGEGTILLYSNRVGT